jgi:photosystem II stability/assembly factor-like uncharacterized protein
MLTIVRNSILIFTLLIIFNQKSITQWELTTGPIDTRCFAVSDAKIFAGTYSSGIFLSTDDGITWVPINSGFPCDEIKSLAISGTNIYAGTSCCVYRSTDLGENWTWSGNGIPDPNVNAITIHGSYIFAGTYGSGIYRSTNKGSNWYAVNIGLENLNIISLASNGIELVAITEDGLYRSNNNGESWIKIDNRYIRSLILNGDNIYAGSDGLLRSTDNGTNWTKITSGLSYFANTIWALALENSKLFAGTNDGIFMLTDDETAWTAVDSGLPSGKFIQALVVHGAYLFASSDDGMWRCPISEIIPLGPKGELGPSLSKVRFVDKTTVIAVGESGAIKRSTDGGYTWAFQLSGTLNTLQSLDFLDWDHGVIVGNESTILKTSDGGITWETVVCPNAGNLFDVVYIDTQTIIAVGKNIIRTTDGGTIWSIQSPPTTSVLCDIDIADNENLFAIGAETFLHSSDAGATWSATSTEPICLLTLQFVNSKTGFIAGCDYSRAYNVILRTTDGGNSWDMKDVATDAYAISSDMAFADENNGFMYTRNGGILHTTDGGLNWTIQSQNIRTYEGECNITCSNPLSAIIVGPKGFTLRTSDAGETWTIPTGARVTTEGEWKLVSVPSRVSSYCYSELFPNAISYAYGYINNKYISYDQLTNKIGYWLKQLQPDEMQISGEPIEIDTFTVSTGWNIIGSISYPIAVMTIMCDPPGMIASQIFGYDGEYLTTDTLYPGDGYWINVDQEGKLILNTNPLSDKISLRKIKIVETSEVPPPPPGVKEQIIRKPIPTTCTLTGAYPNPFNPITTIKYTLPTDNHVTLKIYNTLGELVDIIVNEVQTAGYKVVSWDASRCPSGIYFYELRVGSFIEANKLLLLK